MRRQLSQPKKERDHMCAMSLLPFNRGRSVPRRRPEEADPLLALRQEMSRVFDDFFSGVGLPSFAGSEPASTVPAILTPRMDVSETDDAVRIAVELPGLDEDDVDVTLDGDVLTIRGEKETEREEDRDYHIIERAEGTFLRTLRLPFEADPEQVQAAFRDGVLTITIPKPKEAQQRSRRIEVQGQSKAGSGSAEGPRSGAGTGSRERVDRAAAGDKPASADTSAAGDQSASAAGDKSSGGKSMAGGQQRSASGKAQTAADRK
jgi:HSP20 family protein